LHLFGNVDIKMITSLNIFSGRDAFSTQDLTAFSMEFSNFRIHKQSFT
jgi:hypothetical protein